MDSENNSSNDSSNDFSDRPASGGDHEPLLPISPHLRSDEGRFLSSWWAKGAVILAVIALASIGYLQSSFWQKPEFSKSGLAELDPEELAKRPAVQEFTITQADGKQAKLSDYKGNVVILSFWASWCTPCLVELPTFADLQKKFQDQGLRVVAVNIDEGDEGKQFAKDFWTKKAFPFPSFFDTTKELARQFEVEMLPSNFVIDRQGRLVFSGFGANDWSSQGTIEFIEGLLQEGTKDPVDSEGDQPADESAQ